MLKVIDLIQQCRLTAAESFHRFVHFNCKCVQLEYYSKRICKSEHIKTCFIVASFAFRGDIKT